MGCNFTTLGADEAKFPARPRPLLLQGMAEMRTWRLPSRDRKIFLLQLPSSKTNKPSVSIGNTYGIKIATKPKKPQDGKAKKLMADKDDDDEEGRLIGAFPASPSFRIFFQGDAAEQTLDPFDEVEGGQETVWTSDAAPSEEMRVHKKVKKEGKKRNIRRAINGKKVKNMLNVKACYHPHTLHDAHRS